MEEIRLGDVVQMRKAHPCGSSEFKVLRTGVDIKLECCGCGRVIMQPREKTLKAIKKVVAAADEKTEG